MIKKKKMTIEGLADKIDTGIGSLAIMVEKGFRDADERMAKQSDLLALTERVAALEKEMRGMHGNFDAVFQELRAIRKEIKEMDTRADVIDLQLRVNKLEKEAERQK